MIKVQIVEKIYFKVICGVFRTFSTKFHCRDVLITQITQVVIEHFFATYLEYLMITM